MKQKNQPVVGSFGRVAIQKDRQPIKFLQGVRESIEVTPKDIFVGSGGNYRIKWKEVSSLEVDEENGFRLESTGLTVEATVPSGNWLYCRRLLERLWNKRLEKERRKKEEEEEERREASRPRSYSRKTYSKRPLSFLSKNAANLKEWNEWDSEDDEIFNHARRKRTKEEQNDQQQDDEQQDTPLEPEQDEVIDGDVDDDDDEQEATFDEDDASKGSSEQEAPIEKEKSEKSSKVKRRRFKRKQIQDDDSSDDDDLFNKPGFTTPTTAKRVVSPPTAVNTRKVLEDDDEADEEETQVNEARNAKGEGREGLQDIKGFFAPRVTPGTNKRKSSKPMNGQENQPAPASTESSSAKAKNDFFAPRRRKSDFRKKEDVPPSDASTVIPSPPSTQLTDDMDTTESTGDVITTPKVSRLKKYAYSYPSAKKVEEEDPILDTPPKSDDAPTSQRKKFFPQKRLFKTYGKRNTPGKSRASMALELADTKSPRRSPTSSSLASTPKSPTKSPSSLPQPTWKGLRNLGNTCYMNASLQMIYSIPKFTEELSAFKNGRRLVNGICTLWNNLLDCANPKSATARKIKAAVDETTDKFRGYQQRDAHEFLGDLLDQIHEEIENPANENTGDSPNYEKEEENVEEKEGKESATKSNVTIPTDDFFRLNVEVCLKCKSCGYSRTKEEMYRYLSIDIADDSKDTSDRQRTVEKCLNNFFLPEDRELKCEKCEEGQVASQTMRILSRPKALLLHLKRFVLVEKPRTPIETADNEAVEAVVPGVEMTFRKNKAPVELTEQLSLEAFLSKSSDDTSSQDKNYTLRSVVHHIGSTANSGHYTADALRIRQDENEAKETWVSFDDGITSETTSSAVRNSVRNQKSAYMLLYSTV